MCEEVGQLVWQQCLEQTEENKDKPLKDQLGENCSNLFEIR